MKFRTDFVTNSSDSSFLAFNIKNKALFECLSNLGIRFENTKDGEFSNRMRIVLPSGESEVINGGENWWLPYVDDCPSISAWIVALLLWEVGDFSPAKKADEYSDFSKELIALLNDADIIHLDWEAVEYWSRDRMMEDLSSAFDQMDGSIEDAKIEHTFGFEGEAGPCIYTEVHNGQRMRVNYSYEDGIEKEDCEGLEFAVTGELKYYENRDAIVEAIEEMGGSVSDSISENTDYLICNDVESASSEMKKAKSSGISVLTELAFIRRFTDADEFDNIKDEEKIDKEAWDLTWKGDVLDFVVENGTQPIIMEVWKDGKWQRCVSEQKTALKNAALSAMREEAKNITAQLFNGENSSVLRRLLLIKLRNCLSTEDNNLLQAAAVSFDDLCTRGSLRFEFGPIEAQEETDCFIAVEKEKTRSILGDTQVLLTFTTICKHDICDLDGYKNRALEISSLIIDSVNGKDLDGSGKIHFMTCSSQAISDVYACYTLMFEIGGDMGSEKADTNPIKGYDTDNGVIIDNLLKEPSLKAIMGIGNVSNERVYSDGYIRLSESLSPDTEAPRKSWLILAWDFSTEATLNVVSVSTDKKILDGVSNIVKEKVSGLALPVRKVLAYSEDYSEEEIELSDDLYYSMLIFK